MSFGRKLLQGSGILLVASGLAKALSLLLFTAASKGEKARFSVSNQWRGGGGARSEERRVGKECRIGCRSRWSPDH